MAKKLLAKITIAEADENGKPTKVILGREYVELSAELLGMREGQFTMTHQISNGVEKLVSKIFDEYRKQARGK